MKKFVKALKEIIVAWFPREMESNETPMERIDRTCGIDFWLK